MATEFKWIIHQLQTTPSSDGLQNVVRKISWEVQARSEHAFARDQGVCELESPDPQQFVQYESLDEKTVTGWLWSKINRQEIELRLSNQIQAALQPELIALPLPWDRQI